MLFFRCHVIFSRHDAHAALIRALSYACERASAPHYYDVFMMPLLLISAILPLPPTVAMLLSALPVIVDY